MSDLIPFAGNPLDTPITVEELATAELADLAPEKVKWELRELKPKHKQVCALIAQGLPNTQVAAMCQITPEYVSMLLRQPLIKEEVARLGEIVGTRIDALAVKATDVVAETLLAGSEKGKLQAAKMVFEATGRLGKRGLEAGGSRPEAEERLLRLAERLVELNAPRPRKIFNEDGEEVTEVAT